VPGGWDVASFSARFDTCLQLSEARELPFLLVATGAARSSSTTKSSWPRPGLESCTE
jgi:hypothetical protein